MGPGRTARKASLEVPVPSCAACMKSAWILVVGLLVVAGAASAQEGNETDGPADTTADDGDDGATYLPLVVLVVVAAVAFLLARYGP